MKLSSAFIFAVTFMVVAAIGASWLIERTTTNPYLMELFIEHEESGALYRINRRIYRTKNVCKAAAVALRKESQTIWLEGYPDAYILKRISCARLTGLGPLGPEKRQRLNEKYAQQFIGG